jgi:hypothetical protein
MKKFSFLLILAFVVVAAKAQDDPLKEYVGTYRFPDGSAVPIVDVKLESGILVASSSAGSSPLEKLAKDTFSIVNYNGMMYFIRNADKIIVGMKFEVQDIVQEGKKDGIGVVSESYRSYKSYWSYWFLRRKIFLEQPGMTYLTNKTNMTI